MPSFNLLDEEWIPVVMAGGEPRELSLRDTLIEAGRARELFDASPLVTAALHRLLLAVLWRVFPLRSLTEWKTMWQAERFEAAKLDAYFDLWRERFDLLHPEKPFYQRGDFSLNNKTSLKKLANEFSSGNNGTLFDHSWDEALPSIDPSVAARWIVASQYFGLGGGKSGTGLNFTDCPWSRGAIILLQGDSLFETLCLNLLSLIKPDFPKVGDDKPIWELDENWQPQKNQIPNGLSEYLTWQSRSIRLLADGESGLQECYFAQGRVLLEGFKNEPIYAYRRNEQEGLKVWQFDKERVVWRDSHALFDLSDNAPFQIPAAFNYVARLAREGFLPTRRPYRLQILGQCTEPGKAIVHFWRNESLPLRIEYLNEESLLYKLREAVTLSEDVAKVLYNGTRLLAKALLEFIADRQPDTKDVKQMIAHLQTEAFYWSQLEAPFKQLLADLPTDQTQDDEGETVYGERTLAEWSRALERTAKEAFHIATRSLDGSSRALKAVAVAERNFRARLRESLGTGLNQDTNNIANRGDER